ncbi:MAG: hypothetical protein AB7P34_19245 [Vicinamibacterales bacterium]
MLRLGIVTLAMLLGAVATMSGGQAPAGPVEAYAAAVRVYAATGEPAAAVEGIRGWSLSQFEGAAREYQMRADAALETAAVLQLEFGMLSVTAAPGLASQHLDLGFEVLRRLRARAATPGLVSSEEAATFAERWHVAAVSVFLYANDLARAGPFIDRGLEMVPASRDLRLMAALAGELRGLAVGVDDRSGILTRGSRAQVERNRWLQWAENAYRRLLADQPAFTRARVRLGRVLWLLGKRDGALVELERARTDASEPLQQYLALMFLGALHDEKREYDAARTAYEHAMILVPVSQAATVALGHLDVMAGRPDRAQERARAFLAKPSVPDPWWTYENGGIEWESVYWLRRRVRQ